MPRTDAQRRALSNYEKKAYDTFLLRLHKGDKEIIQAAADQAGETIATYIRTAIFSRIADSQPEEDSQTNTNN